VRLRSALPHSNRSVVRWQTSLADRVFFSKRNVRIANSLVISTRVVANLARVRVSQCNAACYPLSRGNPAMARKRKTVKPRQLYIPAVPDNASWLESDSYDRRAWAELGLTAPTIGALVESV